MSAINKGSVRLEFVDVHGQPLADEAWVTFENETLKSLNFRHEVTAFPVTFTGVASFPNGRWQVHVQPDSYRAKSYFLNLATTGLTESKHEFFIHPEHARPVFPTIADVFNAPQWAGLARVLQASTLEGVSGQNLWRFLSEDAPLLAAGLLNIHASARAVRLPSGNDVFSYFRELVEVRRDRVFAFVDPALHGDVQVSVAVEAFAPASGLLHSFPDGFAKLPGDNSFKTPERAGNFQLTFAEDDDHVMLVDADVDEFQGIKHAMEVLGHIFSGSKTHPYDIHQILTFFFKDGPKRIDLGYDLVPA